MSSKRAAEALQRLMDGNERFVSGQVLGPNRSMDRVREVADAQHPFAAVLGCADSRESMDLIFDCGIGDLFVVRVAGNIVGDMVLGSLEFAVAALQAPLILVLGHEGCGAVQAAMKGREAPGHMQCLVDAIRPVVEEAPGPSNDDVNAVVRRNVERIVNRLRSTAPVLAEQHRAGELMIVGGYHDLHTGRVELLER